MKDLTTMWIVIAVIAIISTGFLALKWFKFDRHKIAWKKMDTDKKIASARVLAELITSDGSVSMVERKEIEFIPSAVMNQAHQLSFDDALGAISNEDEKTKKAVVEIGGWIVKADGHRDPNESTTWCSIKSKLGIV